MQLSHYVLDITSRTLPQKWRLDVSGLNKIPFGKLPAKASIATCPKNKRDMSTVPDIVAVGWLLELEKHD